MPSIDTSVSLDIADMQSQVDALSAYMQSSLADAVGTFDATFSAGLADLTSQVSALTEALQSGLQSATSDASAVGDALDSGLSTADSDVQNLSDSVSSLGDASDSAGGSVKQLGDHTETLKGGAELAAGGVGGLTAITKDLSPGLYGAAGGALALTGGIMELYHAGLDATSAEERFNATLGEQAKAVAAIHVGDLNAGLFELTAKMGSTTAATQNAAATIYQFAQNAGASTKQSTGFTQELFALASRAVALKPSLGDVADVATRMEVGLGRARSAAQQFGISISQAEINTRALQDTGKTSASELTAYEKSVAGAEIALERYGSTLKGTVAEGSKNAAIQQRALSAEIKNTVEELGKAVVAPMLDAIRAGLPIVKSFGEALAILSNVVVILGPVLRAIAPAVTPAIVGFAAFYTASVILPAVLGLVETAVGTLSLAFPVLASSAATAGAGIEAAEIGIEAAAGPIGLLVAGLALAATAFGLFSSGAKDASVNASKVTTLLTNAADAKIADAFHGYALHLLEIGSTSNGAAIELKAFKDVANDNVGTAQRLLTALAANGENTSQYQKILDKAVVSQKNSKQAQDESTQSTDALTTGVSRTTLAQIANAEATEASAKALDTELKSIDSVNDALLAQYDAAYASAKATDSARDAVDKISTAYDEAINQGKNTAQANDAVRRATDDAGEALLKAGDAARIAGEQQSTALDPIQKAHDGYAAQVDVLHHLEDTLAPDSPLRAFLDQYIGKLKDPALTSTYAPEFQTPGLSDAIAQLGVMLDQLSKIPTDVGFAAAITGGAGYSGPRMAGGPVDPGKTYLVGEAGPELFTAGAGGFITPNHMILGDSGTSSAATGTTVTISNLNVTVNPPAGMTPQQADAIGAAAGAGAARQIRAVIGAL